MTLNEPADLENPFDDIAAEYETWYSTALGAFVIASEQEALLAAISGEAGRLLDVGAGTGWWSRLLAGHGFEVTALEPSPAMRHVAATRTGSGAIEWVTGIGEDLPFSDGRFDVVLIMTVLEFAAEPERVLAEAWRVVRPGGRLVLGYLDALSPWAALYRRLGDRGVVPWARAHFVRSEDPEAWLGRPADGSWSRVWLAPDAIAPFDVADHAGRRAGNTAAFTVLSWRKP
jgi:ubiquinone/menaquinone biosynthesis C-methylase UbiE